MKRRPADNNIKITVIYNEKERAIAADIPNKAIIIGKNYLAWPRYAQEFAVFHEIGHFVYNDVPLYTVKEYNQARICCVNRGTACIMETNADTFAQKMCGKDSALKAIHFFIENAALEIEKKELEYRFSFQKNDAAKNKEELRLNSHVKNDHPRAGVFPEKLMPAVNAEMDRLLAMKQKQQSRKEKLFASLTGKKIAAIRQAGGYDSRFDDVVIVFSDGSSLMVQGDFSLTELAEGQKDNEPGFYSITKNNFR